VEAEVKRSLEGDALKIVEENCSICGVGGPLSSGVYGLGAERVRWAMWTCGHLWSSAPTAEPERTGVTLRKVMAAAGLRRHAPI
jgi:hypothetical protein